MTADEKVKTLLKSHWVRYASGPALDGLGSIFGVERLVLRDGEPEPDDAFRQRLQSIVPLFTGGGTVASVLGAVRSALGLPFDLNQLRIPPAYQALRNDIDALVTMREFSPQAQRVLGSNPAEVSNASELTLVVDLPSVAESFPAIDWTFDRGDGRQLSVERVDTATGIRCLDAFIVPEGKTLTLSADSDARLNATLDGADVSSFFVNLNGSSPAVLPSVPIVRSQWKFRARSAIFDLASFDGADRFDLPQYHVALSLVTFRPLTFDVLAPYFLQQTVAALRDRYQYPGELLVYQGLPPDKIQQVIDDTRAAGVSGSIQFSLNFIDDHNLRESFQSAVDVHQLEDAGARDSLLAADFNEFTESQDADERFAVGAVFNVALFDRGYGFM
jgi:hypothetical protein